MATKRPPPKRVAANRRNAKKSTGPKTTEGKARSSLNALRHGLLAQETLLPFENYAELANLRAVSELLGDFNKPSDPTDPEAYEQAQHEEAQAEETRTSHVGTLGKAFVDDVKHGDTFSKLSRYETTIERGLYLALHELQRLQAARLGGDAPLPVAADVTVNAPTSE